MSTPETAPSSMIENPFEPREGEQRIELDRSEFNFNFTRRWFINRNMTTWSTYLEPRFKNKPVNMIQIGIFEGMDLVWSFQNFLGHADSRVLAMDPWAATRKLDSTYMNETMKRAQHNLTPWSNKLFMARKKSQDYLLDMGEILLHGKTIKPKEWDLAIIDGDHEAPAVFEDAVNCLKLMKPGGLMVFDDVRNRIPKKDHVEEGIRQFLEVRGEAVKLVWRHRYCDAYEVLGEVL